MALTVSVIVLRDYACCVFIVFQFLCLFLFFSLSIQMKTCRLSDMEERVKEFATKLTLVPIPPPGQLHVVCVCIVYTYVT